MRNQQKPSSAIITKVAGKSTFVEPIQRIYKSQSQSSLSTPKKDDEVKSIVKKYLGNDALTESRVNEFKSTQGSITTMFHHLSEEGKSIVVSPYKTLSRNDYNRYFDTFQRMQDSPGEIEDEEFHHLKTSSDYSPSQLNQFKESRVNSKVSINSIEEITNDLKQVFESPQSQELKQKIEQSPEFFNPMTPITQNNQVQSVFFLNKDLPVIEENEEIKIDNDQFTKKLNSLLGQIDSKLSFQQNGKQLPNKTIQRIKQKYEPKLSSFKPQDEIFKDFPSEDDIPLSTSQNQTKSIIVNSLKFSERSQTVPEFIEPKGWSFDEDEDHSTQRNEKNQKQNQNQKLKYSIQEYLNPQYNVLTQKSQQNSPAAFEHQQQQQQQQQQKQQKTGMISVIRTKKMIKSIVILLILILIGEVYYVMNSYFQ